MGKLLIKKSQPPPPLQNKHTMGPKVLRLPKNMANLKQLRDGFLTCICYFSPQGGEWAVPGGTAIPGQPVRMVEQALDTFSGFKNQFNIEVPI